MKKVRPVLPGVQLSISHFKVFLRFAFFKHEEKHCLPHRVVFKIKCSDRADGMGWDSVVVENTGSGRRGCGFHPESSAS